MRNKTCETCDSLVDGDRCGACDDCDCWREHPWFADKARLDQLESVGVGEFFVNTKTGMVTVKRSAIDKAMKEGEPDLDTCPNCGGPADNGNDRCVPPQPYNCTKCEEVE